jgi:hypothetical protein
VVCCRLLLCTFNPLQHGPCAFKHTLSSLAAAHSDDIYVGANVCRNLQQALISRMLLGSGKGIEGVRVEEVHRLMMDRSGSHLIEVSGCMGCCERMPGLGLG